jgi:hypothetical protein
MITVAEITITDFKNWFDRDFRYQAPVGMTGTISDCKDGFVTDNDLNKAHIEADINFNEGLFSEDNQIRTTFLYLMAHYLVNDLQTAESGVNSAGYFAVNSRSVGPISESYAIPQWMQNDPVLGSFMTTRYGQKYLSLIKPLLIGNVQVYEGGSTYR